ncbi:transcription repressor NadR [Peptostreptococcus porci]|uniref:transcription repressor NadR n=1 Tax=Peptostreptococcus porci TaxID=2652282 RepID=UPI0023EF95C2|nr:transcription repressor NadR [Peptostreptococcus porci]MDD7182930.1 transcription repressor NadR [Peptostreptococcus porci]MDY2795078.1 transcription repressor NadR [Peptostreptococcus porci]MDY4129652.1 transcription repressor NadR [Peptostreptococcus porci]MDY4560161.1 transcription repressor NadR [Peptostreptococcus porci]MDY5436741.1 transcription repressor NadR [Peptostreptococcus porci]
MDNNSRRKMIIEHLSNSTKPVSASFLAELFGVSRQIIVGDIALLRASEHNIISTNRGYILDDIMRKKHTRVFKVSHDEMRTEEELNIIVDFGGKILDVYVIHELYGKISAKLDLSNRNHVQNFLECLDGNANKPLCKLTDNVHYHTVEAESEEDLDLIEKKLVEGGFLIDEK